jgi:DnaK suppressor protein
MMNRHSANKRRVTAARLQAKGKSTAAQARLLEERELVQRELGRQRTYLQELPASEIEEYDPLISEYTRSAELVEQCEQHLAAIDHALDETRRGAYGFCERCGRPIRAARLEVVPETPWCITCRSNTERELTYKVSA